jgi:hypothetical protein
MEVMEVLSNINSANLSTSRGAKANKEPSALWIATSKMCFGKVAQSTSQATEIIPEDHGKPSLASYYPAIFGVKDNKGCGPPLLGRHSRWHRRRRTESASARHAQHCSAVAGRAVFLRTQRVC